MKHLPQLKVLRRPVESALARSECTTNPGAGWRICIAICSAAQTNSAGMFGAMAQPTTLCEYRSSTIAR